jgi:hypothetical protein
MLHTFLPEARVARIKLVEWAKVKEMLCPESVNDVVSLEFTPLGVVVRARLPSKETHEKFDESKYPLSSLDSDIREHLRRRTDGDRAGDV